jgi:acetyl-CoA acetyltransferase
VTLRDAVIVDYAETKIVDKTDRDVWELGAEILETLLKKTGLEKSEIDGMVVNAASIGAGSTFWSQTTADYLGLELDYCQLIDLGGCSPTGAVVRAAAAIDAGLCKTVLLLFADNGAARTPRTRSYRGEWTEPSGLLGPPGAFGLLTTRYEHLFGLKHEAMGKLAVTQRQHALLNDNACEKLRKPISLDDYLNSRMIAEPVRLLDSVMPCDGATGLIMMSRSEAKARGISRFAVVTGYGERTNYRAGESIVDITETGHSIAGKKAFEMAKILPRDIGSFHPYDDFIFALLLQFEMLGFCKRGQASDYILDNDFSIAGNLPLNTGGGQISAGQAGLAAGGTNLVEGIRQIFGEAGKRQVKNTSNAVVTGIGGIPYARNWWSSVVIVLTPDA